MMSLDFQGYRITIRKENIMTKNISFICLIIGILLCTTGCGPALETEGTETVAPSQNNIESYIYEGDVIYVPISYQRINDGTNGLEILQYVNLNTGVMYIYTEKMHAGYGITWCELRNSDGNVVVYKKLDELRAKYNYGLDKAQTED